MPARCYRLKSLGIPQQFLVEIIPSKDGPPTFTGTGDSIDVKGRITSEYAQLINGILEEASLRLEVSCAVESDRTSKAPGQMSSQRRCLLNLILYGPVELFEEIGSYFEGYEIFLQDPVQNGEQDLRYCNPHRLSSQDISSCPLLSEFLLRTSQHAGFESIAQKPDLFDALSTHNELEEHPQPRAVQTILKRFVRFGKTH